MAWAFLAQGIWRLEGHRACPQCVSLLELDLHTDSCYLPGLETLKASVLANVHTPDEAAPLYV